MVQDLGQKASKRHLNNYTDDPLIDDGNDELVQYVSNELEPELAN